MDPFAAAAQPFAQGFPAPVLGGYPLEKRKSRHSGSSDALTGFLLSHKLMLGLLVCAFLETPVFFLLRRPVYGLIYAFIGFMIAPFGLLPTPRPYQSIGGKILGALGTVFLVLFLGAVLCLGGAVGLDQSGEARAMLGELPTEALALAVFFVVFVAVFIGAMSYSFIRFGFFRPAAWGYIAYFGLFLPLVSLIARQALPDELLEGRGGPASDEGPPVFGPMPPSPFRPGLAPPPSWPPSQPELTPPPSSSPFQPGLTPPPSSSPFRPGLMPPPSPSPSQPGPTMPPLLPGMFPGRGPVPGGGPGAGGGAAEQLAKDLVARLTELTNELATVRDEATMRAATPKVSALVDRINSVARELQDLDARGHARLGPIQDVRFQADIQRLTFRLAHETQRISRIPGSEEMARELAKYRGGTGGPSSP